ncbi:COMM domain-containing protein 4 [Eudromia elegans]
MSRTDPLERLVNEVIQSLHDLYDVKNFTIDQFRNLRGDLEISGELYLDTDVHADIDEVLQALKALATLSVDMASLSVEGAKLHLKTYPVSFLIINRHFSEDLLDPFSVGYQELARELGDVVGRALKDHSRFLQAVIRGFLPGSLICHGDVIFQDPAPTSQEVLEALAVSVGPDKALAGSGFQVDPYSLAVGEDTLEPPPADSGFPDYGVVIIVICGLGIITIPIVLLVPHNPPRAHAHAALHPTARVRRRTTPHRAHAHSRTTALPPPAHSRSQAHAHAPSRGAAAVPAVGGTMRFRFCGDLDCPDWVLAEISTLAKISSVKLKLLCAQVLKDLLGEAIDYEKILKLTSDAKLESGDVKATIAVLSFILSSAAKHNVDSESLSSELQQLGLPKEHATGLCRSYEEKQSALQDNLRACSLRLSRLDSVSWRVDYTLSSSELQDVSEPLVHLRLAVRRGDGGGMDTVPVAVSADKFRVLLAELKQAQALMKTLL